VANSPTWLAHSLSQSPLSPLHVYAGGFFVVRCIPWQDYRRLPPLRVVRPALVPITQDARQRSRQRDRALAWRKLYKTARWQRLRWKILEQTLFTCAMCGKLEAATSQLSADHIIAHKGNEALFWDEGNLQCLCRHCRDTVKKRMEHSKR